MNIRKWWTELFWLRCHYCREKKKYFFYVWELPYWDNTKDVGSKECEICTDCAQPYWHGKDE